MSVLDFFIFSTAGVMCCVALVQHLFVFHFSVQATLVISNSKGPSETLRDIRTSTYQIFRIEEKIIRTTTFNKYIIMLLDF